MSRPRRVKEEFPASSSSFSAAPPPPTAPPQPMERLQESGPPPFLTKTYEIIEDATTNHIVSWSRGNNSFVVWDPQSFSLSLLPKYFKHGNFSSFVRQLNTYGFRKVDPDKWEFAHEGFLRGQKHLLKLIRRRKTPQTNASQQALDPCVEVGRFGLDGEMDRLRRDKQVLMAELVKLRQQQQGTKTHLQKMERRLKKTETKQQLTLNFLARAIQNPDFLQHLIHQKDKHKELEEAIKRKRRRRIDQGQPCGDFEEEPLVKIEPESIYGDMDMDMDVDLLRVHMQEISENHQHYPEEETTEKGDDMDEIRERDLDEGFWENLLNEANEDGFGVHRFEEQEVGEEDADELVDQLGFLSSSPK